MQSSDSSKKNQDKIVYFGVININENGKNIGAIDVWRSVITKKILCEEKRPGILDISEDIGMPTINDNETWALAVNKHRKGKDRWKLIRIPENGKVDFLDTDDETKISVKIENSRIIDPDWWSFLVSKNINKSVEISKEIIQK
ncbi:MAG TPA: hypothetical protein VK338_01675 [Candidatus Nitrosocosmicus sp.]|nr:hypothetical protein [Candidatus Nitrosocosmicus sp.]